MRIVGHKYTEPDEKIHHIEKWYDRQTRSWVIQKMNKSGHQIGDADYVYSKGEAEMLEKQYKKEYKLKENNIPSFKQFFFESETGEDDEYQQKKYEKSMNPSKEDQINPNKKFKRKKKDIVIINPNENDIMYESRFIWEHINNNWVIHSEYKSINEAVKYLEKIMKETKREYAIGTGDVPVYSL